MADLDKYVRSANGGYIESERPKMGGNTASSSDDEGFFTKLAKGKLIGGDYDYRQIPYLGDAFGSAADSAANVIAGAAKFVGLDDVADTMSSYAQEGQKRLETYGGANMSPKLSTDYLLSRNGIIRPIGSTAGSILALAGPARFLTPASAVSATAGALSKVPAVGGYLAEMAPGLVTSVPATVLESASEAGNFQIDKEREGWSPEKAREKSRDVATDNIIGLAGTNALEYGIGGKLLGRLAKGLEGKGTGISTMAMVPEAAFGTGVQTYEEAMQKGITEKASGNPYSYNPLEIMTNPLYNAQYEEGKEGLAGIGPLALFGLGGNAVANRYAKRQNREQAEADTSADTASDTLSVPPDRQFTVAEGANDTLADDTETKIRLLDQAYFDQYGRHLYVTSASRDGDPSASDHNTGHAVDVADDLMESDASVRRWLEAKASELGLNPLDEYENPSANATGGHMHFSDRGADIGIGTTDYDYTGNYSNDAEIDSLINKYAKKYDVDPALVAGIMNAESGFNRNVGLSEAGAIGLMQLMPETAQDMQVDPYDMEQNIEGGVKEIAYYLKKYDGNVELALAAYNAGEGNVEKYNGIPPFAETQAYVPKVMEYYRQHSKGKGKYQNRVNPADKDVDMSDIKVDSTPEPTFEEYMKLFDSEHEENASYDEYKAMLKEDDTVLDEASKAREIAAEEGDMEAYQNVNTMIENGDTDSLRTFLDDIAKTHYAYMSQQDNQDVSQPATIPMPSEAEQKTDTMEGMGSPASDDDVLNSFAEQYDAFMNGQDQTAAQPLEQMLGETETQSEMPSIETAIPQKAGKNLNDEDREYLRRFLRKLPADDVRRKQISDYIGAGNYDGVRAIMYAPKDNTTPVNASTPSVNVTPNEPITDNAASPIGDETQVSQVAETPEQAEAKEKLNAFMESLNPAEREFMEYVADLFDNTGRGFNAIKDAAAKFRKSLMRQKESANGELADNIAENIELMGDVLNAIKEIERKAEASGYRELRERAGLREQGKGWLDKSGKPVRKAALSEEGREKADPKKIAMQVLAYGQALIHYANENNVSMNESVVTEAINGEDKAKQDNAISYLEGQLEQKGVDVEAIKDEVANQQENAVNQETEDTAENNDEIDDRLSKMKDIALNQLKTYVGTFYVSDEPKISAAHDKIYGARSVDEYISKMKNTIDNLIVNSLNGREDLTADEKILLRKLLDDEIKPYMEEEIALKTKDYEWTQIQKAKDKKAEADRIAKEKADNEMSVYHGFMKDATPFQKGKVRKTLSFEEYYPKMKKYVTRAQFVEDIVAEGGRIEAKKGAKRTEYRIYNNDESNSYYNVTKTEYDYAMYLRSKNQQETKKATESGGKLSPKEKIVKFLIPLYQVPIINKETNIKATFGRQGATKMVSNAAVDKSVENGFNQEQHLEAVSNIKELYENASLSETHPDRNNDSNIVSIKRFRANTVVGNEKAIAKITVKESVVNGHKIYSLELEALEKPSDLTNSTATNSSLGSESPTHKGLQGSATSAEGLPVDSNIPQNQQESNDQPLNIPAMYRQLLNSQIDAFKNFTGKLTSKGLHNTVKIKDGKIIFTDKSNKGEKTPNNIYPPIIVDVDSIFEAIRVGGANINSILLNFFKPYARDSFVKWLHTGPESLVQERMAEDKWFYNNIDTNSYRMAEEASSDFKAIAQQVLGQQIESAFDFKKRVSNDSTKNNPNIKLSAGEISKQEEINHKDMLNMVKTEFPSAKNIKQDGDSISFTLNGQNVKVNFVDHVVATDADKEAYKRDYGKEYNDSVEILGKTETTVDGTHILTLLKSGNKDTISHEAFHLAFRAVLNEDEQKALLDKYGDEEAIAEAYRKLMGKDNSRGTMFDMTTKVGRLFQKIWNFAKSMFGLLDRGSLLHDTDSILYAIADGSIYDMAEGKKSIPAYLHPMYTKLMTAWHGSPNKFDKFSTDFMGSGEGQQAWGWGLYFALNRATSEDYILQLSPTGGIVRDRKLTLRFADGSEKELYGAAGANYVATEKHLMDEDDYTGALDVFGYYYDYEINEYLLDGISEPDYKIDAENIADQILMTFGRLANSYQTEDIKNKIRYYLKKTYSANVREGSMSKSLMDEKLKVAERLLNDITDSSLEKYEDEYHNLYKVDIPDVNTMLRTDIKGLEQPKNVQTALESIVNEIQTEKQYSDAHKEAMLAKIKNMRGKRIYRLLVNELGSPKAASLKLLEHGVEGISYTGNRDGDCCVVFNDKAVKILERNGKPVESNTDRQGTKLRAVSDKDKFSAEGGANGRKYSADKTGKQLDTLTSIPREKLTPTEKVLTDFADSIGVGLSIVEDKSQASNRGLFTYGNKIYLNRGNNVGVHKIFWHEFTHWLKVTNPDAYNMMKDAIRGTISDNQKNKYRNEVYNGESMSDDDIIEEMIADGLADGEARKALMDAVINKEPDIAKRIVAVLYNMVQNLKDAIRKAVGKGSSLPAGLDAAQIQALDKTVKRIMAQIKDNNGVSVFDINGTEARYKATGNPVKEAFNIAEMRKSSRSKADETREVNFLQSIKDTYNIIVRGNAEYNKHGQRHLQRQLEQLSGIKIRWGKLGKVDNDTKAIFKAVENVVRAKTAYDFESVVPLLGNAICAKLKIEPSDKMNAYIANWLINGELASGTSEAQVFKKAMQEHAPFANKMCDVQSSFKTWREMSADEQLQATIEWETKKKPLKERMKDWRTAIYDEFVEELGPIERMVKVANAKHGPLSILADPYKAFRLFRGHYGKAITMVEGSTDKAVTALQSALPQVDFTGFKTMQMIFDEAKVSKDEKARKDFVDYCVAKHFRDILKKNEETSNRIEALKESLKSAKDEDSAKAIKEELARYKDWEPMPVPEAVNTLEKCDTIIINKHSKYNKHQQDLVRYSKTITECMYRAGVMSKNTYQTIVESWPNYVPLHRVFEENENDNVWGDSRKHMEGSGREIINPLGTLIHNTFLFMKLAEKNKAKRVLADMARLSDLGMVIEEVPEGGKVGETITFYENGKRKYLETDPSVVFAVNNMGVTTSTIFARFMKSFASVARACYTTLNPSFALRNTMRDVEDAVIYNKITFRDLLHAYKEAILHAFNGKLGKDSETYYEWMASGAAQASAVSIDRNYADSTLKKMTGGWSKYNPKKWLDMLQSISEYSEYGTRMAAYKTAKSRALENESTVMEAMLQGAYESRDLMDFARGGRASREWNNWAIFANASIQGWDKFYREVYGNKETRRKVWARLGMAGFTACMLALAYGDDDWWKELPDWQKQNFWCIKTGDVILRIPKGQDVGLRVFTNAAQKVTNAMMGAEKIEGSKDFLKPVYDLLPSVMPTALAPVIENMANYSFFREAPIVPGYQQKLPGYMQYSPNSSAVAKAFGGSSFAKFFFGDQGVSPRKVDNLLYGYGGSIATTLATVGGMLYGGTFGDGVRVDTDLTSMPMLSGITSDLMKNPKTVTKYYEQFDKQSKYNAEFKQTNKKPAGYDPVLYAKMSKAKNYLSGLNRKERAILMDKSISVSEMKQKQKDIQEKRVYAMKKILGD